MSLTFEQGGVLFRGESEDAPAEVWHYSRKEWVRYHGPPLTADTTRTVSDERAEELKLHSRGAEHYLYYDEAPWAQRHGSKSDRP